MTEVFSLDEIRDVRGEASNSRFNAGILQGSSDLESQFARTKKRAFGDRANQIHIPSPVSDNGLVSSVSAVSLYVLGHSLAQSGFRFPTQREALDIVSGIGDFEKDAFFPTGIIAHTVERSERYGTDEQRNAYTLFTRYSESNESGTPLSSAQSAARGPLVVELGNLSAVYDDQLENKVRLLFTERDDVHPQALSLNDPTPYGELTPAGFPAGHGEYTLELPGEKKALAVVGIRYVPGADKQWNMAVVNNALSPYLSKKTYVLAVKK